MKPLRKVTPSRVGLVVVVWLAYMAVVIGFATRGPVL